MNDHPVVLVVEDDAEMNSLQRELLAVHGLGTVPAYTGAEALDVCAHTRTDAVLLDVMLPELDGFETCRRIKCQTRSLPVVIVTALDTEDCRRKGFEAGADGYFVKPFDPDEVVRALWDLIRKSDGRAQDHGPAKR